MQLDSFYELYSSLSFIHGTILRQMHVDWCRFIILELNIRHWSADLWSYYKKFDAIIIRSYLQHTHGIVNSQNMLCYY